MKITQILTFAQRKGEGSPVNEAMLVEGLGIRGDAYADGGDKQVVIMDSKALAPDAPGEPRGFCREKFKANILIEGLSDLKLKPGMVFRMGSAEITLCSVKGCYELCERLTGKLPCPLRAAAAFGRVTSGGLIAPGQGVEAVR
ncbi:MAG: hypothetical protein GX061_00605 [Eubacteriaceae bacterium]|nr:hypothetical protein [Eubacteriaceae bacterium]